MPCNTITTTTLDLSKADAEVLASALVSMGFTIRLKTGTKIEAHNQNGASVLWEKGSGTTIRARYNADKEIAEKLPQSYAAATLNLAAKRNGWTVKQTAVNKFQVIRRV